MYKSIFVPIDLDEPSSWSKALPTAVSLARTANARLTKGTVIPTSEAALGAQWSPAAYREMVDIARVRLANLSNDSGYDVHSIVVGEGAIGQGILELAHQAQADLIVLASHQPGLKDHLIGAHATHVVRHAPCSVLVVRG